MKLLVTGSKGQLGTDLLNELEKRGHQFIGVDVEEMDITDEAKVREVLMSAEVDGVIHCAAHTAVDRAEDEVDLVRKINALGTEYIAKCCGEKDIPMMYISTDYVFDGEGETPWDPDDLDRRPLNIYGQTKYEGELAVEKYVKDYYIVRIAWVFGLNGNNFIKTMLKLSESRSELDVVEDQVGSPTYTYDLARLLVDMMETDKYGRYHATNVGFCSWYEFAKEIFRQAGVEMKVNPVTSDKFPAKAKRPHNSRMDQSKLIENGFVPLPTWQDALKRYLEVIK
ncbi:dTDP-4-dehydrorhamnose reductase [Lachnospiraceae bacterium PF1-21]|uniref:dTDP-4-dehydrorhamnose reductase n=1 Tax=Ohessyouella blattaphilus TaxID=2949333 RepID=UPI003E281D77